jgi:hypothetical protein
LKRRNRERDQRWLDIRAVRKGHLEQVFDGVESEMFKKPIIANLVDLAARDLTEVIAPLPAFNCMSSSMTTDKARAFADKRTKIAVHYVEHSEVDVQMYTSVDQYFTYGMMVALMEGDFEEQMPHIQFEDPMGGYPEYDRWGRLVSYTKRFLKPGWMLAEEYPEYAHKLTKDPSGRYIGDQDIEVIRYIDADQWMLYLPGSPNPGGSKQVPTVLARAGCLLKKVQVVVARKPTLDHDSQHGQFDEVVWIQIARDIMAKLNIEAVYKSVQAPMAAPPDVQDFPLGADAIIRTNNPEKIRRVGIELPQGAMAESQLLNADMHEGARYPQGRGGNTEASVITGRGIQALMGGFDTQIKTAQTIFTRMFKQIIELCFEMDEKLWPDVKKEIRGQVNGAAFKMEYTPSKDIAGDHTCDVTYGFMAGLDPNRAAVLMLQLRGDKEISRDTAQRAMPFGIDVDEEQKKIDVEEMRDAVKQGIYAYAATIPQMQQMGQDPGEGLAKIAEVISSRQKGKSIEEAILKMFPPPEPAAPGEAPQQPSNPLEALLGGAAGGAPGPPEAAGGGGGGPFSQVAPGQAEMGPGGRPDLQQMLAGLSSSGKPQLSSSVMRRMPA